jgi:O-antigen ligase
MERWRVRGWRFFAVLLALVFFAVRHDRGLLKVIAVLVVVFVLVTPGVLPRAESIVRDVPSGEDTSSMGRVQLWIVGAHLFSEQPLTGVGTGDYAHMHDLTVDDYPQWDAGLRGRGPHNSYVKIAAENGLLGLVPFLVLVSFIWHESSSAVRRSSSPERRALLIGLQSSVLAVLVHAGTNSVLHIESTAPLLWLVLALVCAAAAEENPQTKLKRCSLNSRSS